RRGRAPGTGHAVEAPQPARRALSPRARPWPPRALRDIGRRAGPGAPRRRADHRARRGAAGDGARGGRRAPRPRVLMANTAWAAEFAREVSRPDPEIDLTRAALVIARGEDPGLGLGVYLDRLDPPARPCGGGAGGRLG